MSIGRLTKGDERFVMAGQPLSPAAEAFRVLSTNVRFSCLDKPMQTLLVTSPNVT